MAEEEPVVDDLSISHKSEFNMIELYHTLKDWFEINKYNFYERDHEETVSNGKKSLKIKWRGLKDADDYTRYRIDVSISLSNYEIKTQDKEKLTEGNLSLGFSSRIIEDYEERWSKGPFSRFFRDLADKFFKTNKREMFKKELKNDTYDIYTKAKSFLNLHKFR